MRNVRYGVAGLDPNDLEGSISACAQAGYTACEVQFVKEFTLKEPDARKLGQIAADSGIALSVHAPYFAALTTKEPERVKLHVGALHHASKLASAMGATVVVCHPGTADAEPDELHERIDRALGDLAGRVTDLGVKLGLETCGRKSQFGSLGDIALLVGRHPFTTPVIDFAHIHAVSNGSMKNAAAFGALFEYIAAEFSSDNLWPLHCHFTDNRFGPAGEITHVPYGEGTLRMPNLVEGAQAFDMDLTIISEARWEDSHRQPLEELRSSGAPLGAGPHYTSREIPLERRGEAHYYQSGARRVRITNLDKPLFPDGETKGDLISHYYRVSPLMLPFLRDRPIVMQRVPEGIDAHRFYEKQAPKGTPDWVRTVPVPSEEKGTIDYIVADDVATLVWLAQIASVECHAWTTRWPNLDQPDFAVFDLDPHEPVSFEDVRAVAGLVKVVLDRLGLRAFPKTSGGAGLQVFIPLTLGHTFAEVRSFCTSVGRLIKQAYPEKVTQESSKAKRAGKVFVDANQNAWGKTLVAPYSVRPYPGATVSTPLTWDEISAEFYPEQFTMATIRDRLREVGDLFRPALTSRQDLHPAMAKLA